VIPEHLIIEVFREIMTTPIISIVGKSNSGKTTLVATIKHNIHGFDMDHEGKDSWRHKKAGARTTVISSAHRVALIEDLDHDHSLDEIRGKYIKGADIILSEGYKGNPFPKIEVFRSELKRELLCKKEDNLLAIASDIIIDIGVPCFNIGDAQGIVDLIENKFLK